MWSIYDLYNGHYVVNEWSSCGQRVAVSDHVNDEQCGVGVALGEQVVDRVESGGVQSHRPHTHRGRRLGHAAVLGHEGKDVLDQCSTKKGCSSRLGE